VGTAYGQQEVFTTLEPPTPYVGQSYAGGIVFYVDGTGQHGMVTAPANQGSYTWGCVNTNIATSAAFGAGATNTATLVASCGEANTAAKVADGLVLNGYDDWFLPSVGELNLMRANLYMQGLGGLGTILSSTPQDIRYALALDFAGNYWNWWAKDYPAPVRAIRAF
jgi:hypothetical protein